MAVTAIGDYHFAPRDHAGLYGDSQIVYFCWDRHLLLAAPSITFVPKDMTLGTYLNEVVAPLLGPDPDFGDLVWENAQWAVGAKAFTPDFGATLGENGIGHKDKIIMSTPGLNSLMPDA